MPQDFKMQGLLPEVSHRFAVAYGLSFNIISDLHKVELPKNVEPLPADILDLPVKQRVHAPSKDEC